MICGQPKMTSCVLPKAIVPNFLHEHGSMPIASLAIFKHIGGRFRDGMRRFAEANHIPVVRFRRGDRKVEVMWPRYARRRACRLLTVLLVVFGSESIHRRGRG